MRISTFMLVMQLTSVCLLGATGTSAQSVSMNIKHAPVKTVFQSLERQIPVTFVFSATTIKDISPITVQAEDEPLGSVLRTISQQTGLRFKRSGNFIAVSRGPVRTESEIHTDAIPAPDPARQQTYVGGAVTDTLGNPLSGVTVRVEGTNSVTTTDNDGRYRIAVPNANSAIFFSFVGYISATVPLDGRAILDIRLREDLLQLEETVVVGYGVQKRSDITGAIASLPRERLDMVPNLNIAQAIQGAMPGVMIRTTSAGAASSESIMIRGRNSITASNAPLIVLDGSPYYGELRDLSVNDVESIEVLKDASAAAIYGSRGANGVILITSKKGKEGKPMVNYDGRYSIQDYVNVPTMLNGEEFYYFKNEREPGTITQSEQEVYDAGAWVDWYDVGLRKGASQQHNLSVSGGFKSTNYYLSGDLLDVDGLALNDNYLRAAGRINVDTKIADWLLLGTRTQLSYDDRSGGAPSWSDLYYMNPLTTPYDEEGNLTIYPWPEDPYFHNPLEATLYDHMQKTYQLTTNNFIQVDFPFVEGLNYRLNTGYRKRFYNSAVYRGRNTATGLEARGSSDASDIRYDNTVVENILAYNRQFGDHTISVTGLYSFEQNTRAESTLSARGFPHDFLTLYAAAQAELVVPDNTYSQTRLISQMLRLNYAYDSRYLLTLTGRRDGFSGFGANNKWGNFPSIAVGWNAANEAFFPWKDVFRELKLRMSWGINGNQAVSAYQAITRLGEINMVSGNTTLPGYRPSVLGADNLGWESSATINAGLDFSLLNGRVSGDINVYKTNTSDLLLRRTISPIHGITSILQNIGKTENKGLELSVHSNNITVGNFKWSTRGNVSLIRNRIVSLYGELDEQGNEIDDLANSWFIGQPISVSFGYIWDGVWQLDEVEEAAKWDSQPGFLKIRDVNRDGVLNVDDRQILGRGDPSFLWGLNNSFAYKNFKLDVFIYGSHGVRKSNPLMNDEDAWPDVRRNTTKKNWWTPENPTNDWYMNHIDARRMDGLTAPYIEDAGFVRVRDISFSYDFTSTFLERLKLARLRLYVTGRNLYTFTKYTGMDPELSSQRAIPLQKEYVFGVMLGF